MNPPIRILIVEDEPEQARALAALLPPPTYAVELAHSFADGVTRATTGEFDVVITDLHLSGSGRLHLREGLALVRDTVAAQPHTPVIVVTGQPSPATTIEAARLGAFDHLIKPIEAETLLPVLERAVAESRAHRARGRTRITLPPEAEPEESRLIGRSPAMNEVWKQIGRLAATTATVLLRGETGTGKELVARTLHAHSDRAAGPLVVVNCPAIQPTLFEKELFGSEAGAFTDAKTRTLGLFEQATGGSIFLDEIGDLPLETQSKLLRVLQNKTFRRVGGKADLTVDARILAATHRDLELAVAEGKFRADLYHRISAAVIHLPPLRERRPDIPELTRHFLALLARQEKFPTPAIEPQAMDLLQQLSWPGNVRELQNVLRQALLLGGSTIRERDIQQALRGKPAAVASGRSLSQRIAEWLALAQQGRAPKVAQLVQEEVERELYAQALRLAQGDRAKLAAWLGVSRPTLREKLIRYGLDTTSDAT